MPSDEHKKGTAMRPSHGPSLPKAHLYMLLQTLIISGSFPVVSSITPGIDSTLLAFWRFLAATFVFFLMLAATRSLRVPGWHDMGRYSVVGGSYAGFFILMFESLKFTSPINTSTIYTTLPLTTLVMAGMLGEPIRLWQVGILACQWSPPSGSSSGETFICF